jgi:hypothetical protein
MAIIILLLIIAFISLKYYLSKKYMINIVVDDNSNIADECFYNHDINIIYCKYMINNKKYDITKKIKNMLDGEEFNKFGNSDGFNTSVNSGGFNKLKFNSMDFKLPPNGVFKIGYVCYLCNNKRKNNKQKNNKQKNNEQKNNFINLAGIGGDSISIPNDFSYNGIYYPTNELQNIYNTKTQYYDLTKYAPKYEKLKNDTITIPVHSSSTQNSIFWNNPVFLENTGTWHNNITPQSWNNPIFLSNNAPANPIADLMSVEKKMNASVERNDLEFLLNTLSLVY